MKPHDPNDHAHDALGYYGGYLGPGWPPPLHLNSQPSELHYKPLDEKTKQAFDEIFDAMQFDPPPPDPTPESDLAHGFNDFLKAVEGIKMPGNVPGNGGLSYPPNHAVFKKIEKVKERAWVQSFLNMIAEELDARGVPIPARPNFLACLN